MFIQKLVGLFAVTIIAGNVSARAEQDSDIRQSYINAFGQHSGSTVLDNFARVFQQLDPSGQGLTAKHIQTIDVMISSGRRGGIAGQWLSYDLDGDLKVSRNEFETIALYRGGSRLLKADMTDAQKLRRTNALNKQIDEAFKSDMNNNGFIDGLEIYQPQVRRAQHADPEMLAIEFARVLLKSDPNNDGVLTQMEASQLAADALVGVDEEIIKASQQQGSNRALGIGPECPKIEVEKDSQLVMFGTYQGSSLSNLTVAGQDEVTNGATVLIEDGDEPLTVFLTSNEPMIWKFTGATQRVKKVVAFGGRIERGKDRKTAAGVIGIEKSKLQFVKSDVCIRSFHSAEKNEGVRAKAAINAITGKNPDKIFGQYSSTIVALPSGEGLTSKSDNQDKETVAALIAKSGAQFFTVGEAGKLVPLNLAAEDSVRGHELLRFSPTGVMNFNINEVVSEAKVEAYEVYPQLAGVMQLKAQGKITNVDGRWRINEKIRIPSGLAGALNTSFFIPKGVDMPEGDLRHGCIRSEESGIVAQGICIHD